ncbi:MAG: glucose-6-phosphate dehydrogenase assembly protein OpcA [Planctomycetes bacterium]|nr:glucose-6-phosphate dehydrogenase assembly protein OpcA [Planctomycetota bacterium]
MSEAPALCRTPPRAVPLPQIPDALRAIWRTCGGDERSADGADVARSLAINFVGTAAAADEPMLRAAVERLQGRTPCRAFLLLVDDRAAQIGAEVSATTRLHGGTHDIVLEEITVRLPSAGFERLPGLVRPLLVNDLPNHLFWATAWPRQAHHFDDLAALCEHTVVDTRLFAAPALELGHLRARRDRGARVTDLNWLRLRPWRRALAEAYERLPAAGGARTEVRLLHGRAALAATMLLGEWLEARLGARVVLDGGGTGTGPCPDRVVLRTADAEIDLQAPDAQIVAHVSTAAHCFLPFQVPASRGTDGDLLAAAIDLG